MDIPSDLQSTHRKIPIGKQIMEDGEREGEGGDPTAEITCGVCLSDGGWSIQGRIDSCEHYFCFVCIMEWAKVENRCPMCKKRFQSIRRPTVPGIFLYERVVNVTERNQVYHPLGNESRTLTDPYVNVICNECQTAKDEELLLLCDLCDSASHTYCVGLGATVPEGDWYCCDCTKIRDEHSKTQLDSDSCNQDSYNGLKAVRASQMSVLASQAPVSVSEISSDGIVSNSLQGYSSLSEVQSSQTPVSIYEIISEGIVSTEQILEQESVREHRRNPIQRDSQDRVVSIRENVRSTEPRGEQQVRTLRQCRNLQDRIRQIRENWNFLRSGSLAFSSSFNNSSSSGNRSYSNKRKNRVDSATSREPESLSSVSSEHSADVNLPMKTSQNAQLQDVSKAWKMMKIAKSVGVTQKGIGLSCSSNSFGKVNTSMDVRNRNPRPFVAKSYDHSSHGMARHTSFKVVEKQHKCAVHKKEIPRSHIEMEMERRPEIVPQSESSSHKLAWSFQQCSCLRKPGTQQVVDEKLTVRMGHHELNYRGSATLAMKSIVSSSGIENFPHKKHSAVNSADKTCIKRNDKMNCSAKDEVQSLVKLNLKLQGKNQLLDADKFREVARVATHTILAACGMEHSKSCARNFDAPKCNHSGEFREILKSNLMPNSCRECFYSFVKDVVNSIFLEKI